AGREYGVPRSPRDQQSLDAADGGLLQLDLLRWRRQAQPRQPVEQRRNDRTQLHARQLLSDALVDAVPERELSPRRPADVERVGVIEAGRVTVGRPDEQLDGLTLADQLALDLHV